MKDHIHLFCFQQFRQKGILNIGLDEFDAWPRTRQRAHIYPQDANIIVHRPSGHGCAQGAEQSCNDKGFHVVDYDGLENLVQPQRSQ